MRSRTPATAAGRCVISVARVAGVVRAVTGSVGASYGAGIPIADAMPFHSDSMFPKLKVQTSEAIEIDWPAVDALGVALYGAHYEPGGVGDGAGIGGVSGSKDYGFDTS